MAAKCMTLKCRKVFTELVENNVHVNISSVECTAYLRHWKGWVCCTINKSLIAAQFMIDTGPMCFDNTTFYWRNTSVIKAQEFRFVMIWRTISPRPQVKTGNGNLKNYVHKWQASLQILLHIWFAFLLFEEWWSGIRDLKLFIFCAWSERKWKESV